MSYTNIKKNKRILILFLITITISFMNVGQFIWNSDNIISNKDHNDPLNIIENLKVSDYSSTFSGIGENMIIELHQSYLNNSYDTPLSPSDSNNNSFIVPSPTDTTFISSFVNITIQDLSAPNKTLDLEKDIDDVPILFGVPTYAFSFDVPSKSVLKEFEVCLTGSSGSVNAGVGFQIWNATWTGSVINPDTNTGLFSQTETVLTTDTKVWHKLSPNIELDPANTKNSTFFIVMWDTRVPTSFPEFNAKNDGVGQYESLVRYMPIATWLTRSYEISSNLTLTLSDNTPKPTDIGLEINGSAVNDDGSGENLGYWISRNGYSDVSGKLNFQIQADWWNVTGNITNILINFTKTDLVATSEFNIAGSGQNADWNVTRNGGLNFFDKEFNNYRINYTIPTAWSDPSIKVFNATDERTGSISKRLLGNGYREIFIPNAGNGTFWYLTASSTNLLSSIDTYIGSTSSDVFNYSHIAHFNATFSETIAQDDGAINLSVYSPIAVNNKLNYSINLNTFTAGSEISIVDWDISNNVTQFGNFRIHVYWKNNTAAGFLEKIIKIYGETDIMPNLPALKFNASDTFNISIFFNDTGLDIGIDGASITYRLGNGAIRSDDIPLGGGNYRITIDCNDTDFSIYGNNLIEINATKDFYNNQSTIKSIVIIGETSLDASIPKLLFNSTETFIVSFFFNDTVKEQGISGAIRNVFINQTSYTPISNIDQGDGNYNLIINGSDDDFATQGYGFFNLSFEFEKSFYNNQTTFFIIYIQGNTSLSATKFPDPVIGYYNTDEIFNITVYFEDLGRNEGINGGQVNVYVKEVSASSYQEYITTPDPFGNGLYNLTIDCSDPLFRPYGKYNIKINISKENYITVSYILEELVVGNTTLTILDPTGTIFYVENENFDITIEYIDHTQSTGIADANITYSLDGTTYKDINVVDNTDGTYTITVDVGDPDFSTNYADVDIIIRANKTNYINLTRTLTFERQILTQVNPLNPPSLIEVIRGNNITYTFNYSDNLGTPIDKYGNFQPTSPLNAFEWFIWNDGGGNYTLDIGTSNVVVVDTSYILNFSISAFGNQSQDFSFNILVKIIQTRIETQSWNLNADFARSTDIDISIDFYFNDTTNEEAIISLVENDIIIKDYNTGTLFSPGFNLYNQPGPGNYILNISTVGISSDNYILEVNISKYPNYNWSLAYFAFYLRGNYSSINLISLADPGGLLIPEGNYYNYTIFEGSDLDIEYNVTDLEYFGNVVLGDADYYIIQYENLYNSSIYGYLSHSFDFVYITPTFGTHQGLLNTSQLLQGSYSIEMLLVKKNYVNSTFTFNLTINKKLSVNISIYDITDEITAGEEFNIALNVSIIRNSPTDPLVGASVSITSIINGIPDITLIGITNSSGIAVFQFTIPLDAINLSLQVSLESEYNIQGVLIDFTGYSVNPSLSTGIPFEVVLTYIIIIGAVVAIGGGSLGVYKGVIVPKKRAKARVLAEVKTLFDDAINLEHVLIIYKGTGTCVFFKSFGSEQIDPDLISGFITAICSFGKDLVWQEELNEISYGEKMLLLTDGEHIRVALVLGKKASLILRKNLKKFISIFEETYANELPNWRGQLDLFRSAGTLIDEMLNTSIILPHEITYEFSSMKALKKPHSREVLKIAEQLMKDTDRNFFFIATLLNEAAEKTNKDTAEIFMGIKELRDQKILMPIDITTLEAPTISQQELNLIEQKISTLENILPEEKQKLVNDLAKLGPAEREAYFSSMEEQKKIISAPIDSPLEVAEIENVKKAKKQIKILQKKASSAKKEKNYDGCIKIYQNAAKLATEWELHKEFHELDEIIRTTKIEDLRIKKKAFEKDAKEAVKVEDYNEASQKYRIASKIASEIFKLGGADMTKEVKRLSNKSKEYEKLI